MKWISCRFTSDSGRLSAEDKLSSLECELAGKQGQSLPDRLFSVRLLVIVFFLH